ncbi:MAG: regulator of chromosome condensation [Labilithrix sp.]|nr:regulator of chromosome condensation [Labilithrix sp.]
MTDDTSTILRIVVALVLVLVFAACAGAPVRAVDMEAARANAARSVDAPPPLPPHMELQATQDGVCELVDHAVRCAGRNMWGEVGDGTREPHAEWFRVPGTEGAVQLAAGGHHVCVRLEDGTARCWGDNAFAQTGDGIGGEPRMSPVGVAGVREIEELSAGTAHTCARVRGGDVLCWGGQIDSVQIAYDLDPTSRRHPAVIAHGASRLVTGYERTYAKTFDGWVTWAPKRGPPPPPLPLPSLADAVDVSSGLTDECALTNRGEVRCWGSSHVSLGSRPHDPSLAQAIPGLTHVIKVSTHRLKSCALQADGHVQCWPAIYDVIPAEPAPELVAEIHDAVDVTSGFDFACARLRDASVKCWGKTDYLPEETALQR